MEEQKLCKKCIEQIRPFVIKVPNSDHMPWIHCHHKEPEPCWCDDKVNKELYHWYVYCPQCGKKIERR